MKFSRAWFMLVVLPGLALPIGQSLKQQKPEQAIVKIDCCPVPQCPPFCGPTKASDLENPLFTLTFDK